MHGMIWAAYLKSSFLQHHQSTQFSRPRWKGFKQDCKCEGPYSKPQWRLLSLGDSGLRWTLCREPCGSSLPGRQLDLTCTVLSSTKCLALGSHITCCLASLESFLHLFWAGIPGTGSQSYFCNDDIKPGISSFVIPGSPWGETHPCAEGQHAELHHFSHAGALGCLSASNQKSPAFEAWLLCSLGWVWDRQDLGCCLAAEAPQGWGKHTIDPVTSQLVSALHYFLTSSHFKSLQRHKHID